jgi:putative hydroxymethylpyrimidine transport system substrate-binding protein
MKISLAIEWFLNPDHLPFIVAQKMGYFAEYGVECTIIEPDEHYDGLEQLRANNIEFALNEPLHLIEQFNDEFITLGTFFETQGGVLFKRDAYHKLGEGKRVTVTTPVSNDITNRIGYEIIKRYAAHDGIEVTPEQVAFVPNGFEHIKYMREGADAGWLYFENFEGVEADFEKLDVIRMDAKTSGFANFSALDVFTSRTFLEQNPTIVEQMSITIKRAIFYILAHPKEAKRYYYEYTKEEPSELMDAIIDSTIQRFDPLFSSDYSKALPILEFFREIEITSLTNAEFKKAFLG